jgi:hypothetical protein
MAGGGYVSGGGGNVNGGGGNVGRGGGYDSWVGGGHLAPYLEEEEV